MHYRGGGEMIMYDLIKEGIERGHDIAFTSIRPYKNRQHSNPDVTFFADVFNFPHTLKSLGFIRRFSYRFIREMMGSAPFVHLNNAYADVCNLPHLPCSGAADRRCPHKSYRHIRQNIISRDFSVTCFGQRRLVRELFEKAALSVFLSPLHAQASYAIINLKMEDHPYFMLKPMIDSKRFTNRKIKRDIDYLFVGLIGEAKGLDAMRRQYADKNIFLIGNLAPGERLDFGHYIGFVPYEEIPVYMNRAKRFVFLPRWPEPQGRVIVEAAMCGCELVANENVGALSFDFDIRDPNNFINAGTEFWERIEGITL